MNRPIRLIVLLGIAAVLGGISAWKHGSGWTGPARGGSERAPLPMPDLKEGPARELVAAIRDLHPGPPDEQRLEAFREAWSADRVHPLLDHDEPVVRQCAAIALRHVGERASVSPLVDRLRDPNGRVRAAANNALWRVWFGLGSDEANRLIEEAKRRARREAYGEAIELMDKAIEREPDFAEAYNQRAIIYFQMGEYAASAEDCRRTIERMPQHYGALSGLGRCLMRLGRDAEALEIFRRARRVNPNLNVDGAIEKLKQRLDRGGNRGQAV